MTNEQIAEKWANTAYDHDEGMGLLEILLSAIREATAGQAERIEELREELKRTHDDAYICGLEAYAWWKDGVQYVGTSSGHTLEEAIQLFKDNKAFNRHPL